MIPGCLLSSCIRAIATLSTHCEKSCGLVWAWRLLSTPTSSASTCRSTPMQLATKSMHKCRTADAKATSLANNGHSGLKTARGSKNGVPSLVNQSNKSCTESRTNISFRSTVSRSRTLERADAAGWADRDRDRDEPFAGRSVDETRSSGGSPPLGAGADLDAPRIPPPPASALFHLLVVSLARSMPKLSTTPACHGFRSSRRLVPAMPRTVTTPGCSEGSDDSFLCTRLSCSNPSHIAQSDRSAATFSRSRHFSCATDHAATPPSAPAAFPTSSFE
mmetsp:Transcript_62210/g.171087  ORF Transcript_62210/g.171087 Transcript_62210/m.171087 type:complete len:276 (+) Transcript_62210:494-1321(+)